MTLVPVNRLAFTLDGGKNRSISVGLPPYSSLITFRIRSVVTVGFGSNSNGINWTQQTRVQVRYQLDTMNQIAGLLQKIATTCLQLCIVLPYISLYNPRLGIPRVGTSIFHTAHTHQCHLSPFGGCMQEAVRAKQRACGIVWREHKVTKCAHHG